jgi:hypothetical protein
MVRSLGEDLSVAFCDRGARQAVGVRGARLVRCSSEVGQQVPKEKWVLASEPGIMLNLFSLVLLGVVVITVSGIARAHRVLYRHESLCFRCLVPGDR